MQVDLTWCIEQLNVGLLGNAEVEVKAVLAFHGFLKEEVKIRCPQEMICLPFDAEKLEKQPGIVGYIVKEGDTLWDLAKRYGITGERILEMNDCEKNGLKSGDKILIFKESLSIL